MIRDGITRGADLNLDFKSFLLMNGATSGGSEATGE